MIKLLKNLFSEPDANWEADQEFLNYIKDTTVKSKESIDHKCIECSSVAITLINGICNTCLSKKDKDDMIKWPSHYNTGKIQPIDAIEDWKLDFRLANAVKYIARAGKKDPTKTKQDLEKSIWYIQRYIDKELKNE